MGPTIPRNNLEVICPFFGFYWIFLWFIMSVLFYPLLPSLRVDMVLYLKINCSLLIKGLLFKLIQTSFELLILIFFNCVLSKRIALIFKYR
jgi:hypothetical protein